MRLNIINDLIIRRILACIGFLVVHHVIYEAIANEAHFCLHS
jgi:hypothetical protein